MYVEVKSYVIGLSAIILSNQRSAHCYQEVAPSCAVVVSLFKY